MSKAMTGIVPMTAGERAFAIRRKLRSNKPDRVLDALGDIMEFVKEDDLEEELGWKGTASLLPELVKISRESSSKRQKLAIGTLDGIEIGLTDKALDTIISHLIMAYQDIQDPENILRTIARIGNESSLATGLLLEVLEYRPALKRIAIELLLEVGRSTPSDYAKAIIIAGLEVAVTKETGEFKEVASRALKILKL